MTGLGGEIGTGVLARGASTVQWHMVIGALMALICAPGLVVAMLLAPEASNLPLFVVAALPVGPAFAAALYAFEVAATDRDLSPGRHFVRGLRLNTVDVLRVWVPGLAALALIAANATAGGGWLGSAVAAASLVIALVTVLWLANVLVIVARFSFRSRDVARLAVYYLFRAVSVPLAASSLLVLAGGLALLVGEWLLLPTASLFAAWLYRHSGGMRADIEQRFVA